MVIVLNQYLPLALSQLTTGHRLKKVKKPAGESLRANQALVTSVDYHGGSQAWGCRKWCRYSSCQKWCCYSYSLCQKWCRYKVVPLFIVLKVVPLFIMLILNCSVGVRGRILTWYVQDCFKKKKKAVSVSCLVVQIFSRLCLLYASCRKCVCPWLKAFWP